MSVYEDLVGDFPSRCADILRSHEDHARSAGREVTLMLAMAAESESDMAPASQCNCCGLAFTRTAYVRDEARDGALQPSVAHDVWP